ncbi:ATP-binding protein [Elusimicrobiota bacterium]
MYKVIIILRKLIGLFIKHINTIFSKIIVFLERKIVEKRISLRKKLLILFSLITLPSLIFILLTYTINNKIVVNQLESFQKAVVTGSHKLVEHYVKNCQKSMTTLGSEKNFRYLVSIKNPLLIKKELIRVFRKNKNFRFLAVVTKNNNELYTIAAYPEEYKNMLSEKHIADYMEENYSHPKENEISNAVQINQMNEVLIVFPLRKALVVGAIDLNKLASLLEKTKPIEESRFILLDPGKGYIKGGVGRFPYDINDNEGSVTIKENKSIAYYAVNEGIEWTVLLATPKRIIYGNLFNLRLLVIIFIILGITLTFLIALYFSDWITKPIGVLNKGARILGEGNLNYRIDLITGDELEELAKEFNMMGEELKKSYDSMGEKIRIATKDLELAYEEIGKKNEGLEEADRIKSEFLASMSHELRTPINAIIGFTSLMEEGIYGNITEKQKETLKKIMRNTHHLLNLINDILDLSKIEAGRMELHPEKFKLSGLINEIIIEVSSLAHEKNLEIKNDLDDKIKMEQDFTRLKQVIMNLISNAIKFTNEGYVQIKTYKDKDNNIAIDVSDTGIGIKEEQLDHIFDEFVQADGSITREFGGTGLGLSISKKLADMMGGKMEVNSVWEEGSTFRLLLPIKS